MASAATWSGSSLLVGPPLVLELDNTDEAMEAVLQGMTRCLVSDCNCIPQLLRLHRNPPYIDMCQLTEHVLQLKMNWSTKAAVCAQLHRSRDAQLRPHPTCTSPDCAAAL